MHMDGGAAKITLLGTIIRSRIHTASQSLSFIIYLDVFFFFSFVPDQEFRTFKWGNVKAGTLFNVDPSGTGSCKSTRSTGGRRKVKLKGTSDWAASVNRKASEFRRWSCWPPLIKQPKTRVLMSKCENTPFILSCVVPKRKISKTLKMHLLKE